ncbi:hypothetical protein [Mycolicibacterium austroafricanum]|uniref:hypothetical protein n=1 Tax=Mycolicibacterium austroafricanum TaxID=39687 RepID=UPI001CA307AD|nr:hypothetical protein [Mycolicibacterium austroafricanum]QZT62960.1 hypothetical protein JN085_00635 [Mycolicibacterium austroafricanum]
MANPPPGFDASGFDASGFHDGGDHDDLAALDVSIAGDEDEAGLDVIFGDFGSASDDDGGMPLFTVTNPPGTVTVTTYMDGRVHQIELSPSAAALPEAVLADEIVVIAGLATQDARSAQYTFMLEGMREHGHDNVTTRDFLNRDLDLPTPEQARAARAELFTTRYAGDE